MAASPRAARLRRALAISSSAVALVVVAAACGTASASTDTEGVEQVAEAGHSHHGDPAEAKDSKDSKDSGEHRDHGGKDGSKDSGAADKDRKKDGDKKDAGKKEGDKKDGDKKDAAKLDILGTDCDNSDLEPHDGFQKAPRCVETSFGEVTSADKSPSLLITESPRQVAVNQDFTITVSTRNLKRDRFLGAAVGGYYAEASFLDDGGIQRGHFHTACRFLPSLDEAPDAAPDPAFFLATQDNKGGAGEDKVVVDVPGQDRAGTLQCAVWAGDGSHRVPMMERANQTPAFDVVRINVK